jgi:predicted DNA-binding transcriptional regulator YafY
MSTNPQARVLELLKRFNNGQKVSIEVLQNDVMWFEKSEKTIRRDLDVIKEYFPDSFELIRGGKGEKGTYKAITKEVFDNFMNKDTLALMVQTFNIAQRNNALEELNICEDDKRIIDSKIKKTRECYEFITKPYETKKGDIQLLKEIETAIHGKRYSTITQTENIGSKVYEIKPYKIVFMNEVFYLACENLDEKYPFSMFRITNILKIQLHSKTFHKNLDIEAFIKNLQTPFAKYTPEFRNHLIDVVVNVSKIKAKYFKAKKYLKTQKIIQENEDGSLNILFRVTQEIEMEELIKKWIPHVKVIEPIHLKNRINQDLKLYLEI